MIGCDTKGRKCRVKLITRDTDYAIRALCFIAQHKGEIVSASKLVKESKIPRPFLRKILQTLNKKKILDSLQGKGGGFRLRKNPRQILLIDLMQIFQGRFRLNECLLKKSPCPNINNCPLRRRIDKVETYVVKELSSISLFSLLRR